MRFRKNSSNSYLNQTKRQRFVQGLISFVLVATFVCLMGIVILLAVMSIDILGLAQATVIVVVIALILIAVWLA
jgi:hypothetical protein